MQCNHVNFMTNGVGCACMFCKADLAICLFSRALVIEGVKILQAVQYGLHKHISVKFAWQCFDLNPCNWMYYETITHILDPTSIHSNS